MIYWISKLASTPNRYKNTDVNIETDIEDQPIYLFNYLTVHNKLLNLSTQSLCAQNYSIYLSRCAQITQSRCAQNYSIYLSIYLSTQSRCAASGIEQTGYG